MSVSDFRFNALADQLRATEQRLANLERRSPVGDGQPWDVVLAGLDADLPTYYQTGRYVRMNGIVFGWASLTFTGSPGAGTVVTGTPLWVELPYPAETLAQGYWQAYKAGFSYPAAWGPLAGFIGSTEVFLQWGPSLDEQEVISVRGLRRVNLSQSIIDGGVVVEDSYWANGDSLSVFVAAQLPAGS